MSISFSSSFPHLRRVLLYQNFEKIESFYCDITKKSVKVIAICIEIFIAVFLFY